MKFFDRMLTQFLARANPASTQPKPRFMKNTRKPVIITHNVSKPTRKLAGVFGSGAGAAVVSGVAGSWARPSATGPNKIHAASRAVVRQFRFVIVSTPA